ncbi:hypothetical protein Cfor_01734 [Coptotermes formosanus]|uniref:NTF2 domain-containing protein n=1 Tax=Coptotermes formosanus TaxID=36987 RepID=A0A6L2Q0A0_COPFO|nr:hypothetical protein Cfor_01734 [Coptotermes formosanus]
MAAVRQSHQHCSPLWALNSGARGNPYSGRSRNQTGGSNTGGRGSGSRRRSGRASPSVPVQLNRKKVPDNMPSWYKVIIPHGGRYSKEYILKALLDAITPTVFIPLNYEVRGADSSFFVDDSRTADKLASVDRKIMTFKGFRLVVKVKPDMPHVELNCTLKEKIKAAMVKRYNAALKALDLSRFHADPDLVDNYAVALFRPNMMLAVVDVIVENVPELVALDLSENKLYALDSLSVLSVKLPNLRVLHIGKNRIRDMHQLDRLEGLCLEDLVLDGNPLCDRFQDQNAYISEVRKRFPKVLKLDGVDLSPPILFDVNEDFRMPTSKGHYICAEDAMSMARQFLEQYFQLYDSDNREQLVSAYHTDAMFSLTSTYPPGQSSTTTPKLVNYISDSRNLLRVKDNIKRQKLLYQGKMAVVACLSKLPRTQHDPLSFTVDVTLFTPQVIMMSVSGLFLEHGPRTNQPLRSFSRVFVIVPFGAGFCIINEQLFVTNATEEQSKVAFKTSAPAAVSPPASVPVAASPPVAHLDENTKQHLIESFAAQSGMNVAWARKKKVKETAYELLLENVDYNFSNTKMVSENFLKEMPVRQMRKHCEETIFIWNVSFKWIQIHN